MNDFSWIQIQYCIFNKDEKNVYKLFSHFREAIDNIKPFDSN
jgi:hypothetical protein